jgi:DNA-binding NtrC family response regulator
MLVDDEAATLSLLTSVLRREGFENVVAFTDSHQALESFTRDEMSLVVLDLSLPSLHGRELLGMFSEVKPYIPVIVATAENRIETAIDCMKTGAVDYITKPISLNRFIAGVRMALELRSLNEEIRLLDQSGHGGMKTAVSPIPGIITEDQEMLTLLGYAGVVAKSRQPVLISGETGVGKELVAQAVHNLSGLKGNFISINIAGLDDQMFSDTLFGHRRGAFTGALNDRDGLIQKAAHGTIFLDEIGDLNEMSQIKLLRLLQENEYYQLGSDLPLQSSARLVVATNKSLWQSMNEGRFRKDLYFRLCTHQVAIPPLRRRRGDIPLLFDHYIKQSAKAMGKSGLTYRKELIDYLLTYEFPGNIRELQAIVHDFVSRSPTATLSLSLLKSIMYREQKSPVRSTGGEIPISTDTASAIFFQSIPTLKYAETVLIEKALELAQNNQGTAARMLGITRQALNGRLRRKVAEK